LIFWTVLIKRAQTAHIVFSGQSGMFMKSEPEEAESGSSHCQRRASGWMAVFLLPPLGRWDTGAPTRLWS
jgi:hypothetical protein